MTVSLRAMAYFTAALRHGNIARAAAELNVAASAVASAIDRVEAEFDLKLVSRQRARGISANASGLVIAQKFERLLEDHRAIMAEGADLASALSGSLRIGYYAPVAPAFLPAILDAVLTEAGSVELHLEECDNDDAQEGLLGGAYDAILFVSEDVRPSIEFDVLVEAPAYCLLPSAHALAGRASVSLSEIAREPLVILDRPVAGAYYRGLLDAHDVAVAAYASSTEMVRGLVGAGRGCAVLNMRPLTDTTYAGDPVVALPISDPLPPLTLAVGYDRSRPRRLVERFAEACRAHFAQDGPSRCIVPPHAAAGREG